jgi:DNA-binding CsgD family transcriptional regulator
MAALRKSDAERLLAFVGDAQTVDGPEPFTTELLDRLAEVMGTEFATYQELDLRTRLGYEVMCSRERQHPKRVAFTPERAADSMDRRLPPGRVVTWSETVERDVRRRFDMTAWARTFEVIDCAVMSLEIEASERGRLILHSQGRDYTDRDRHALGALRPHVEGFIRNARARRRLADLLAVADSGDDEARSGFVLIGPSLGVEHASPAARRMLRYWFDDAAEPLPRLIEDWLRSGPRPEPLRVESDNKYLVVEAATTHALLLTEQPIPPARLTAREQEVLRWLAAGKSTSEIAGELWVTPATVSKHLHHIYRKLGVTSRTGALAALALRDRDLRAQRPSLIPTG